MVGRTLGHYRLLELVGQGGMASVYRARDLSLDRECAVKVLHRHLQGDKESRLRFQREAQAVARLRHQNILEIYAYSVDETDESYLVTEFIHGATLRAQLGKHQPRFPEVGAMVGCAVARALSAAHREGVIHRDIKPENIMLRRDGTLVLCDFGIARLLDKDTVTTTGQLLGSPAYMAPEHIKGQQVDSRSDLFALGTLLYELVSGELPFRGKNPHDTLTRIAAGVHVPLAELSPLASPVLAAIVERALDPSPDSRYQEASVLEEDLAAALKDSGIDDWRAELSAYFLDPAGWEAAFRLRLKARLLDDGRQLRRAGRIAGALSAWGRAQLLDPEDPELRSLLASVAQRSRQRRAALFACGVACTGLLLGGGQRLYRRLALPASELGSPLGPSLPLLSPANQLAGTSPIANSSGPQSSPASQLAGFPPPLPRSPSLPIAVVELPSRQRPVSLRQRPAAIVHSVRLEPWPKAVQVVHNGRPLGAYGTDVRTVQLVAGANEFLFENPACYSEKVVLPPGVTPEEVRVRLRWKPALLLVNVRDGTAKDVAGADVLVDGRLVGRSGQVVALPLLGDDGSRAVDVQISAPGRRTIGRALTVRANQLSQLDLALPPL